VGTASGATQFTWTVVNQDESWGLDMFAIEVPAGRRLREKAVPHHTERRSSAKACTAGLGRKGFATTAALSRVRVRYLETTAGQSIAKINHGATHILGAERIDKN
jgi:hypothetical protein